MDKGLKKGAIGYISNIVIGVASTAPAYSLAATLGFVVAVKGVGVHAPAVLLVSFIPMLLVASAYKYARPGPGHRVDERLGDLPGGPDRDGLVVGHSRHLHVQALRLHRTRRIQSRDHHRGDRVDRSDDVDLLPGHRAFSRHPARAARHRGVHPRALRRSGIREGLRQPSAERLDQALAVVDQPVCDELRRSARRGPALGVFIYWGWDSGVAVNEESEDPAEGPGKAAVVSTLLLLVIYVLVSGAAQAFHGVGFLTNEANQEDVLNALGKGVLGGTLDKLLIITVLTSASASTQTTILPTARTTLSMAHWKAVTNVLSRMHKRYLTPTVSTLGFGLLSIIITIPLLLLSSSVLEDSITAIGFPICFYYGFTGFACPFYYRHELGKSLKNFLLLGAGPMIGGLMLFGVGIKAAIYYSESAHVSSAPILGITLPLWMGIGGMVLGVLIMLASRPVFKEFFSRKLETAPPGVLEHPPVVVPAQVDF
jgi:hypothetical protein